MKKTFCIIMGPEMRLYPRSLGKDTKAAELWLSHSQHVSGSRDQLQFSIKIGAAIFGYCLLGSYVLPVRLTGHN
jgi:hypothetical protein